MENLINLGLIEKNEFLLKGKIFTQLQLEILKKKLKNKALDSNEKTYYYKYIKPKLKAMLSLFDINELNIKGREFMIEHRIQKAISILNKLKQKHKNKKIMISGSYLFNRRYNDIDVFVFSKYNKDDYRKGKIHVNFIPESSIDSLFFRSISAISISNFLFENKKTLNIEISDLLQKYEILIENLKQKNDIKHELREFLLGAEYISRQVVLNPMQLYRLMEKTMDRKVSEIISNTLINTLVISYKKEILKKKLKQRIDDYIQLKGQYKSHNIDMYIKTYKLAIELAI